MKKAGGLVALIALVVAGSFIIKGMLPILPVFGTSMEPSLHAGSIVLIEDVRPRDVKVGDIIAFNVPSAVREYYNYPPVVAHRVKEVNDNQGILTFRTKGDNTGEEPFAIRPQDIRGKVGDQIPYVGFPLLFLQSQQGMIFMIAAVCLFGVYMYRTEITQRKRQIQEGIFAPVLEENRRTQRTMEQRMEGTEKALDNFSTAMSEYAEHLKSHTSAVQGLSSASQQLSRGTMEQNRVLSGLAQVVEQMNAAGNKINIEENRPLPGLAQAVDQMNASGPPQSREEHPAPPKDRALPDLSRMIEDPAGALPPSPFADHGRPIEPTGLVPPPVPPQLGDAASSDTAAPNLPVGYGEDEEKDKDLSKGSAPSIDDVILSMDKPKCERGTGLECDDWLEN